jgi:glycosyltransferase involved in cell wall biosynthesis
MTEVGGSAAVYFDPDDPQAAAEAIAAALADRPRLVESGFANASRFGSEAMLRAYMDLYHRLAGGSE